MYVFPLTTNDCILIQTLEHPPVNDKILQCYQIQPHQLDIQEHHGHVSICDHYPLKFSYNVANRLWTPPPPCHILVRSLDTPAEYHHLSQADYPE